MSDRSALVSKVIETKLINWKELRFLQEDTFKELSAEIKEKLKASILSNNFAQPFYVWECKEDGLIYCLDGKHRTIILHDLIADGVEVPDMLPATFIECKDKTEAAKLVIIYSSIYAKTTHKGLFDFIEMYELEMPELKEMINLPEFDLDLFEQMNFTPLESDLIGEAKDKPASMKITFVDEKQLEKAKAEIDLILEKYEGSFMSVSCGEI